GLAPVDPLASPVAFAIPRTTPTDAAARAADATAVRRRDSCFVFTWSMSSEASVMDSPFQVDIVFSPRRFTACSAIVSDEGVASVTLPWTVTTLLPILLITFTVPRADRSTETGVAAGSWPLLVGTY